MAKLKNNKTEIKTKEENKPSGIETEKKLSRFLEEVKITNDYLKHVATLDTGSILIMASFLQKSAKAGAGSVVAVSAFFFILSIVGVVAAQALLVRHISDTVDTIDKLPSTTEKRLYRSAFVLAYVGFVIGIATLAVFIFYNL